MPSGPEGDQRISEHTLMHPEYKRLDFTLVSFPHFCCFVTNSSDSFLSFFRVCFQVNAGTRSGVPFLASFCIIIIIYCTCTELVSTVIKFKEFWGWNFFHTKLQIGRAHV